MLYFNENEDRGVSNMVGAIILLSIMVGLAGIIGSTVINQSTVESPSADIVFEQVESCDNGCVTDVSIDQVHNADYVVIVYDESEVDSVTPNYIGSLPTENTNVPDDVSSSPVSGDGHVLLNPGDSVSIVSNPDVKIDAYVGINNNVNLEESYNVNYIS